MVHLLHDNKVNQVNYLYFQIIFRLAVVVYNYININSDNHKYFSFENFASYLHEDVSNISWLIKILKR